MAISRPWRFKFSKMVLRMDGHSGETLLVPCARKKGLHRKLNKDHYRIGVEENISMFSK